MSELQTFIPFRAKSIRELSKSSNEADVIVFTAEWCGTCVIFEKILNKLLHAYKGQVDFYRADFDKYNSLAAAYGIYNPPALLYTRHGKVLDKSEGTSSGVEIIQRLEELIKAFV